MADRPTIFAAYLDAAHALARAATDAERERAEVALDAAERVLASAPARTHPTTEEARGILSLPPRFLVRRTRYIYAWRDLPPTPEELAAHGSAHGGSSRWARVVADRPTIEVIRAWVYSRDGEWQMGDRPLSRAEGWYAPMTADRPCAWPEVTHG